jgi:hypothetical protein
MKGSSQFRQPLYAGAKEQLGVNPSNRADGFPEAMQTREILEFLRYAKIIYITMVRYSAA